MAPKPDIFNGTSISAGHVGDAANDTLNTREVQLTPGGDLGNSQVVDVQVLDANGKPLKEVSRVELRLFEATMIESLAAAWTMAETGAGTEVSTTAQAALVVDTDENGGDAVPARYGPQQAEPRDPGRSDLRNVVLRAWTGWAPPIPYWVGGVFCCKVVWISALLRGNEGHQRWRSQMQK
jgi:hypothetical protein